MMNTIHTYCFATNGLDAENSCFLDWKQRQTLGIVKGELYRYKRHGLCVLEAKEMPDRQALQPALRASFLPGVFEGPLERIFKKPLPEGLVQEGATGKRFVMTLALKNEPGLLDAYKAVHHPDRVWPQILANMDTMGILELGIYLSGYQAFLLMTVVPDFDMERDAQKWGQLPQEQEWQQYVSRFQKIEPKSQIEEKWEVMSLVQYL